MSTTDSMKFPMLFHWGAGIFSGTWYDLPGQKKTALVVGDWDQFEVPGE